MKLDLPTVDDGKEIAPDQRERHHPEREQQRHAGRNDEPVIEQFREQARIAVPHRLESVFEPGMKARKHAGRSRVDRTMMFVLEQ